MFLFALGSVFGQTDHPISYEVSINRISDTKAEVVLSMTMKKGWHVYAAHLDSLSSPLPTEGYWNDSAAEYTMVGNLLEPEPHEDYDPNFDETLKWHEEKVIFRQQFIINVREDFSIKGEMSFMACNNTMCLPPEYVTIDLSVKGAVNPIKK